MKTKNWIFLLIIMGTIVFLANSCKDDDEPVEPVVELPLLITSQVVDLTQNSATSGGNVLEDGGGAVTARGVVWNTAVNPTVTTNVGMTSDGTGLGIFTSNLTDLEPETSYYVRAYATNSAGTAYGNEINFTTPIPVCENCVEDVMGNVYHYVTIGNQDWLVENLRTTKYNDGTDIPLVTGDTDWHALPIDTITGGAYCYYDNDPANRDTYGLIYNYAAAASGKLAIEGWRVPSKDDFEVLIEEIGGAETAGGKLKATGIIPDGLWADPNLGATDEFGFHGIPGGFRWADDANPASWGGITTNAIYQTITESDENPDAWNYYFILWHDKASFDSPYWAKQAGCSVKLVRDHE